MRVCVLHTHTPLPRSTPSMHTSTTGFLKSSFVGILDGSSAVPNSTQPSSSKTATITLCVCSVCADTEYISVGGCTPKNINTTTHQNHPTARTNIMQTTHQHRSANTWCVLCVVCAYAPLKYNTRSADVVRYFYKADARMLVPCDAAGAR